MSIFNDTNAALPLGSIMRRDGLYRVPRSGADRWICPPFHIRARIRYDNGDGFLIEYREWMWAIPHAAFLDHTRNGPLARHWPKGPVSTADRRFLSYTLAASYPDHEVWAPMWNAPTNSAGDLADAYRGILSRTAAGGDELDGEQARLLNLIADDAAQQQFRAARYAEKAERFGCAA